MLFLLALPFAFSASKESDTVCIDTYYGTLYKSDSGEYTLVTGNSRNRASIFIKQKKGSEEEYRALSEFVGKEVKIEGIELSRKSFWNITIALVSVSLSE